MNTRTPLVRLFAAFTLTFALNAGHLAAQTTVSDAVGDIQPGIWTADGVNDIVKMEISDSLTDVIFAMTVNGNTTSGGGPFAKLMIGIATTNATGTTNGNGWSRPINMIPPVGTGMTHWIGTWLDGGTGVQFFSYNGTGWTGGAAPSLSEEV